MNTTRLRSHLTSPCQVVFVLLLSLAVVPSSRAKPVVLSLGETRIELDERGRVTSLRSKDGQEFAPSNASSAFEVATSEGVFQPTEVSRTGGELLVRFGGRGQMCLAVTEDRGFAILKLKELAVPGAVERLQLFCLPVKGLNTLGSVMNAC